MGTMEVCRKLGISYWQLFAMLRSGEIIPPQKKGRDFVWGEEDLKNVRRALRRLKERCPA